MVAKTSDASSETGSAVRPADDEQKSGDREAARTNFRPDSMTTAGSVDVMYIVLSGRPGRTSGRRSADDARRGLADAVPRLT